jgi:lactate dehydrogenase-like 2-hydroxyacid dehydrogenase
VLPANRQFTGPFDAELLAALPASLRFICHNGAGYDNVDVGRCSARGIRVSSTPVAVNHATADVAMFLMIGALRQAYVPISALRGGMLPPCLRALLATCLREPDRQLAREDYARPRSPA